MLKRILSAIVGVSFALGLLILSIWVPFAINIAIALICILAIYEMFTAMGIFRMYGITIPSFLFAAAMPLLGEGFAWQIAWYLYTLLIFSIMIFMNKVLTFKDIAVIYSMNLLITLSLSKIITLRDMGLEQNAMFGIFFIVMVLALPWMADTGAYFFGSFLGKHKLCPDISPKKTVEGVVGGVIVCVLSTLLVGVIFDLWIFPEGTNVHYLSLILLVLVASVLSVLGDLCFSLVKRGCHIKDFGNAIPGHGGILDRFDSVVFVAPFLYLFAQYLPLYSV